MKKTYCDLCTKEITRADIPVNLQANVGGKELDLDFHSHCYYEFLRELKERFNVEDKG